MPNPIYKNAVGAVLSLPLPIGYDLSLDSVSGQMLKPDGSLVFVPVVASSTSFTYTSQVGDLSQVGNYSLRLTVRRLSTGVATPLSPLFFRVWSSDRQGPSGSFFPAPDQSVAPNPGIAVALRESGGTLLPVGAASEGQVLKIVDGKVAGVDEPGAVDQAARAAAAEALEVANAAVPLEQKGQASGIATLGSDGKVPSGQLPTLTSTDQIARDAASTAQSTATAAGALAAQAHSESVAAQTTADAKLNANDPSVTNARTPTAHASSHVSSGTDVIANAVASGNAGLMSGTDKAKLDGIATGATVGADWNVNVSNRPTLGTASAKDAPASGDASATQLVLGDDSRLLTSGQKSVLAATSGINTGDKTLAELGGVAANGTITASGATNKIVQYDAKGLVLSGVDANTANVPEVVDKRYCTDAQKTVIGNTSNTNTGDETVARIKALGFLGLARGTNLTDADQTINPGSDAVSLYVLPAATLTGNRVKTVGVAGTLIAGVTTVWILREDLTANTLTLRNGGANGTAIADVVLPANPAHPMLIGITYDGVDMVPHTVVYVL